MRFGVSLVLFLVLTGCMPPSDEQLRMEKDLAEMKRRLAQVEVQQADAMSSTSASGDSLQRQVAELAAGLDNLRVEFQSVNGRLDDLGQNNQQLEDDLRLTKEDLGLQLDSVSSRVDQLEQNGGGLAEDLNRRPASKAAGTPKPQAETAEQLYQRALDKIRNGADFAEGRELLQEFIAKYPEHDLYVNALYWSGEALYGEKQYELAILQLQDVISKHGNHPKAAAAMLKQAMAFSALGDVQNAQTTMRKLIKDYPDSSQVAAAKKFLAD